MIEMPNIDILFMTKTAQQRYPLGATHTYVAHKRETPFLLPFLKMIINRRVSVFELPY